MGIKLWSRKQGILRPPTTPLYAEPGANDFPSTFRDRVVRWAFDLLRTFEWGTTVGDVVHDFSDTSRELYEGLSAAYGREQLGPLTRSGPARSGHRPDRRLARHVAQCPDVEVIDFIDATVQLAQQLGLRSDDPDPFERMQPSPIDELNMIFEEEGVGYRWAAGQIVRFDGEVTPREAIMPAIAALARGHFGAAESEFSEAAASFARGAWRDTTTHANAALESVLKIKTGREGTAGELINEALKQGLIPNYLGRTADAIAKIVHGVNATRSQQGSVHGLGDREPEADERLARLALTMTEALIEFLADDGVE